MSSQYEGKDRRGSWFVSAESTITLFVAIFGLVVAALLWGGHADSQITNNKISIQQMQAQIEDTKKQMEISNEALLDKMEKISDRLLILETKQTVQVGLLQDIQANVHHSH